jgi:ribosome maturation factor RimP
MLEKIKTLSDSISSWILPLGYRLLDLEIHTQKNATITIYIDWADKDQPITIEDCIQVNNLVDPLISNELEKLNFFKSTYHLEVSSPGVFRRLKEEDFLKYCNHRVKVITHEPIQMNELGSRQKTFIGVMRSFKNAELLLECEQPSKKKFSYTVTIPLSKIERANLAPDWNAILKGD